MQTSDDDSFTSGCTTDEDLNYPSSSDEEEKDSDNRSNEKKDSDEKSETSDSDDKSKTSDLHDKSVTSDSDSDALDVPELNLDDTQIPSTSVISASQSRNCSKKTLNNDSQMVCDESHDSFFASGMSSVDINKENSATVEILSTELEDLLQKCKNYSWFDKKFFAIVIDQLKANGQVAANCKCCNKVIKGKVNVSSNFTGHLKRKHPDTYNEYIAFKRLKLNNNKVISKNRGTCSFSQTQFDENVTIFILDNQLAARLVKSLTFRKIFDDLKIKNGKQALKHLSWDTVIKNISLISEKIKNEIIKAMSSASYVCTTADIWSSPKRRFIGVTAHWMNCDTLERKSAALACIRLSGTHSFDRIAVMLEKIHLTYNLSVDKISATITDNGSNFVKAFKEFGLDDTEFLVSDEASNNQEISEDIDEQEFVQEVRSDYEDVIDCEKSTVELEETTSKLENQLPRHFRCASHTLNLLATTDYMKILKKFPIEKKLHESVIKKCSQVWKCLGSPKQREILIGFLGVSINKPIVTRWNSLNDCLLQIYNLKNKLKQLDAKLITKASFENSDFIYIKEYLVWSKPLANAIDKLQAEKNNYYGYLLPTLLIIKKKWNTSMINNEIFVLKPIVENLITELEKRFKNIFEVSGVGELAVVAALTHPRFKSYWVNDMTSENQEKVAHIIKSLTQSEDNAEVPLVIEQDEDDFYDFEKTPGPSSFLARFETEEEQLHELIKFFSEKSLELELLNSYPMVKNLFIKSNTPLPSSASVERMFSYSKMQDLPKFNRLTDDNFEKRVLAKVNLNNNFYVHKAE